MNYRSRRLESGVIIPRQLIPILTMAEITGVNKEPDLDQDIKNQIGNACSLFLFGTNQFGLRIDSIDHTEEIVVKPLAQM